MSIKQHFLNIGSTAFIVLQKNTETLRNTTFITNQQETVAPSSWYAALEVNSDDSAFLLPRLTDGAMNNLALIPGAAVPGMMLFNVDEDRLYVYSESSGFTSVVTGSSQILTGKAVLNGNNGVIINSSEVTTNSRINVTRNLGALGFPDVVTIGDLFVGSIVDNVSFTVYSTVSGDVGNIDWSMVND